MEGREIHQIEKSVTRREKKKTNCLRKNKK
jgi:hypothetical protein